MVRLLRPKKSAENAENPSSNAGRGVQKEAIQGHPTSPSVSTRKHCRNASGRSPGSWIRRRLPSRRFDLPWLIAKWFDETTSHLQWRDRAGLTPDFPFMPSRAPEADIQLSGLDVYACARAGVKLFSIGAIQGQSHRSVEERHLARIAINLGAIERRGGASALLGSRN